MLGWAQPSSQVLFLNVHFVVKATVRECFHPGKLMQMYDDLGELGVRINLILLCHISLAAIAVTAAFWPSSP